MSQGGDVFQGLDQTQIDLMKEECILVDENDQNIGSASKKTCHLLDNINKGKSLGNCTARAFKGRHRPESVCYWW